LIVAVNDDFITDTDHKDPAFIQERCRKLEQYLSALVSMLDDNDDGDDDDNDNDDEDDDYAGG